MNRKAGFTLVEIMIVVAIIGLLAAIAVPAFMKARNNARRSACVNNLRLTEAGKDNYAIDYGGTNGMALEWWDLRFYLKDVSNKVYCPSAIFIQRNNTNYNMCTIGNNPTCIITWGAADYHCLTNR